MRLGSESPGLPVTFLIAMRKYLIKAIGEGGVLRDHSPSRWRRYGSGNMRGLGHITSGVGKERKMNAGTQLISPFY